MSILFRIVEGRFKRRFNECQDAHLPGGSATAPVPISG